MGHVWHWSSKRHFHVHSLCFLRNVSVILWCKSRNEYVRLRMSFYSGLSGHQQFFVFQQFLKVGCQYYHSAWQTCSFGAVDIYDPSIGLGFSSCVQAGLNRNKWKARLSVLHCHCLAPHCFVLRCFATFAVMARGCAWVLCPRQSRSETGTHGWRYYICISMCCICSQLILEGVKRGKWSENQGEGRGWGRLIRQTFRWLLAVLHASCQ